MRIFAVALIVLLTSCASTGGQWVRADGSSFTGEQLERDRMACFPTIPQTGPGSMGLEEAKDCMRKKGWTRSSS